MTIDSSDKDAYTQALEAQDLRTKIGMYASSAVQHAHVDRDWVNGWLAKLGVPKITGQSEYRINIAITGNYGRRVTAASRAEATKQFMAEVERVAATGKITLANEGRYDNVYDLVVTGDAPVFHSGPEDQTTDAVTLTPDELKAGIRQMLKEGVAEKGWGLTYANAALENLGLESLPKMTHRTVEVPITGTTKVGLTVYEDDSDEDLRRAAARYLTGRTSVSVQPVEIGDAVTEAKDDGGEDEDVSF